MNRIVELFKTKKKNILSIYFTAGFPKLNDTVSIIKSLEKNGVDLIEIGMPFSDPLADGPTIQQSSVVALNNGMSINKLFEQIKDIRKDVKIPLILMGYLNPIMQYGIEKFCTDANRIGIDGVIIPDLPLNVYLEEYKAILEKHGLLNIFLLTPQTPETRIRYIDINSEGFIYMVSSASTTGTKSSMDNGQLSYFERIKEMKLKNPVVIGFGISDKNTFEKACEYASGAIIGSAFVSEIEKSQNLETTIHDFVKNIKN